MSCLIFTSLYDKYTNNNSLRNSKDHIILLGGLNINRQFTAHKLKSLSNFLTLFRRQSLLLCFCHVAYINCHWRSKCPIN